MLVTATSAVLYDADKKGAFEKYMKAQADALERLIEDEGLGIELHDIILVTECCLTRDWAIMVVRDSSSSSSFGFEIAALDANIQGSVARLWSSQIQVPLHQWPPNPPLRISNIGKPEPHNDEVYRDVEGTEDSPARTQCIFLRGYRVSRRRRWLGMKIRAAAEPQDLPEDHSPPPGPVVRADGNTPELMVLDESLNTTEKVRDSLPIPNIAIQRERVVPPWRIDVYQELSVISFRCVANCLRAEVKSHNIVLHLRIPRMRPLHFTMMSSAGSQR